jgi:hypothetical protein
MATIRGPWDAPHGRVIVKMDRWEAEHVAEWIAAANVSEWEREDDQLGPLVAHFARIADDA